MSLYQAWVDQLLSYANLSCIEDGSTCYTYGDLLGEVNFWSARFDELCIQPGTAIAIRSDYSIASIAVVLSLLTRRAVVALIPRATTTDRFLRDSYAQAFLELSPDGTYKWTTRSLQCDAHPLIERLRAANCGGLIIFTSGSTGHPKAALHSIERFLEKFRKPGRRLRTLAFLLMDHIAGLDTLFYTLTSGGAFILTRSRLPLDTLKLIHSHAVEVLPTSPSFLRMLCATKDIEKYNVSSLRVITYGSEPMDGRTLARLNKVFSGVQIIQKYGSTEVGSPRTISRGDNSLWLKFRQGDAETKIIAGILWIRCEHTILGYLNAPWVLDEEGWYCTGDRVRVEDDWIQFLGRETEVINVGGEKVSPAEVEEILSELDVIQEALVFGAAHALMGQVVCAQVILVPGVTDEKETRKLIRLHCRRRLPLYKVPFKIDFVLDFSVTERHKRLRSPVPQGL